MKVTLSFEKTQSSDVSIMVDVLRASTTITLAFDNFNEIIPCFSPQEAFKIKQQHDGILAGERNGVKLDGFDIGNSPQTVQKFKTNKDRLILTTTNGTRILESMNSNNILIGSLVNAKAVGDKSLELASSHIDLVMAGVKGNFALEDFLACGEIIYWISIHKNTKLSDYAKAALLASRDYEKVNDAFFTCRSGVKLKKLNYIDDIKYCLNKNITDNVAIYKNGKLKLI